MVGRSYSEPFFFFFECLLKDTFIYLNFIYFLLCQLFVDAWAFSLVVESGGYSPVAVLSLLIVWLPLLPSMGLRVCGLQWA